MELGGKKVLVTGADGFIGSHLTESLIEVGCVVRAMTYYNAFDSLGWLDTFPQDVLDAIEIVKGDIRDPNGVNLAVSDMDVVFHLAALIGIPFSYHSPDSYVETNIKGTLNVLQAARSHSVKKLLVTSTSEVYGTAQYVPIDEHHPFQGQSPYSASKIGADRMTESFWRSFDVPAVIVRPFNTYGPRQSTRAVIPTVIAQILAGADVIKLGNLSPTRDFNFVKDVVSAFLQIAAADNVIGEELNVATGFEVSIGDIADMIAKAMGRKIQIVSDQERVRPESSEIERLLGSAQKLNELTGWSPRYDLTEGLGLTIAWFEANRHLFEGKAHKYTV